MINSGQKMCLARHSEMIFLAVDLATDSIYSFEISAEKVIPRSYIETISWRIASAMLMEIKHRITQMINDVNFNFGKC